MDDVIEFAVIFDGQDACEVHVPHGTYRVTRSQPASNWHLTVKPTGDTARSWPDVFAGLELSASWQVKGIRYGSGGPFSVELLDALVLAARAFRDRDIRRAAAQIRAS
jgi:hypothetical protein